VLVEVDVEHLVAEDVAILATEPVVVCGGTFTHVVPTSAGHHRTLLDDPPAGRDGQVPFATSSTRFSAVRA